MSKVPLSILFVTFLKETIMDTYFSYNLAPYINTACNNNNNNMYF